MTMVTNNIMTDKRKKKELNYVTKEIGVNTYYNQNRYNRDHTLRSKVAPTKVPPCV